MEAKAITRYVRIAPRKMVLIADLVRGKNVNEALSILHFSPKRASQVTEKTIRSALANLMDNEDSRSIDIDKARITEIRVNEGPTWKRFRPRAMGRASRIHKRTSHLYVTIAV